MPRCWALALVACSTCLPCVLATPDCPASHGCSYLQRCRLVSLHVMSDVSCNLPNRLPASGLFIRVGGAAQLHRWHDVFKAVEFHYGCLARNTVKRRPWSGVPRSTILALPALLSVVEYVPSCFILLYLSYKGYCRWQGSFQAVCSTLCLTSRISCWRLCTKSV